MAFTKVVFFAVVVCVVAMAMAQDDDKKAKMQAMKAKAEKCLNDPIPAGKPSDCASRQATYKAEYEKMKQSKGEDMKKDKAAMKEKITAFCKFNGECCAERLEFCDKMAAKSS